MSCDAAAALFLTFVAHTAPQPALMPIAAPTPAVAQISKLASEPLYAGIIDRAQVLLSTVNGFREALANIENTAPLPGFDRFKTDITALSNLDMQGHMDLAQRGTDGDLKCILRGISQDLMVKLDALGAAPDLKAKDRALREIAYLLNDNIEVITAPPAPPV